MMKRLYLTISIALLSSSTYAAPTLQLHVFDEEKPLDAPEKHLQLVPTVEQSPARRHRLQTHVFVREDIIPGQYYDAMSAKAVPRQAKKPLLEYQHAEFYTVIGYRQDNLDWSIAGLNGVPNILSELTWEDIRIVTITAGTTLYFQPNWLLNFDFTYGHIFDGDNQDSDYNGNNRTLEFSRSNNSADKGSVIDASIHAGYKWTAKNGVEFIPKVGFSYHSQFLNITDGFQTIPALGAFAGLDSNYDATWMGPWLGLESHITVNKKFKVGVNVEYHYAFYDATANWNLRTDSAHPESFTHEAEGYGLIANISGDYQLSDDFLLTLSMKYQDWQADRNGVDKTYFSNGTALKTGFNGVNWQSFGANLGLSYQF